MEERRTDYYGQEPRPPRPMYPQGQGYGQAQGYGQRQGYMPAVRPIPPMPEQTPVLPVSAQGIRQLTRAERAEAARIAAESEFTTPSPTARASCPSCRTRPGRACI